MASSTDGPAPRWTTGSRLWLVQDHEASAPLEVDQSCRLCIKGGVDAVLCRMRGLSRELTLELATRSRTACGESGVPFVVSHDVELARLVNADGVQFGKADGEMAELALKAGQGMPWGYSSHSIEEAGAALAAGASWVFLGPVFPTPEKLRYGAPLGLEAVTRALTMPDHERIVFIGGINLETLPQLVKAGGRRAAAIAALQDTDDPEGAARQMRLMLGNG